MDAIKQHGANQTSGLGRNALTAFSPSIPPNRIALRVAANSEQSAISTVSLDRADRQNLEASAIFSPVAASLAFPELRRLQDSNVTPEAPPRSSAPLEHNLVNVTTIYPPLLHEIRYATACNFTGQVLYPFPAAFVHRDVAAALQRVQQDLRKEGLCLKIFDGYRPGSIQFKMWELVRDERYVSDPTESKGKHTRGTAVDVTLVDGMGNELVMPTSYDDFSDKAHRFSAKWTKEERTNSLKLEAVMKKHGFIPFAFEWWHYDYVGMGKVSSTRC